MCAPAPLLSIARGGCGTKGGGGEIRRIAAEKERGPSLRVGKELEAGASLPSPLENGL